MGAFAEVNGVEKVLQPLLSILATTEVVEERTGERRTAAEIERKQKGKRREKLQNSRKKARKKVSHSKEEKSE